MSLVCVQWATASPLTMYLFTSNGRQFTWPSSSQWSQIERSDQTTQATSPEGYNNNDYGNNNQGGFQPSLSNLDNENTNDYNNYDNYNHDSSSSSYGSYDNNNQNLESGQASDNHIHTIPVSEHVQVTKPVVVPVYKNIGEIYLNFYSMKLLS